MRKGLKSWAWFETGLEFTVYEMSAMHCNPQPSNSALGVALMSKNSTENHIQQITSFFERAFYLPQLVKVGDRA